MHLNEYQRMTSETAIYPLNETTLNGVSYCVLGLAGEAGELANKVKKILRGDVTLSYQRAALIDELGDCLWYAAQIARCLEYTLDEVAYFNIQKLLKRREEKKLQGDGDNR